MARAVKCAVLLALFAFGAAQELTATNYRTDDGHHRTEATDGQGNVRGEYSYVDPNGKTITVKYTAGKDGFKVEGDHLPKAPAVPQAQAPAAPRAPAPQWNQPQQQWNQQPQQQQWNQPQQQQWNQPQQQQWAQPQQTQQAHQWDQNGQYNPPAHETQEWSQQSAPAAQPQAAPANPEYITNPLWNAHTQPHWAQIAQQQPQPQYNPPQPQYNAPQPQWNAAPRAPAPQQPLNNFPGLSQPSNSLYQPQQPRSQGGKVSVSSDPASGYTYTYSL